VVPVHRLKEKVNSFRIEQSREVLNAADAVELGDDASVRSDDALQYPEGMVLSALCQVLCSPRKPLYGGFDVVGPVRVKGLGAPPEGAVAGVWIWRLIQDDDVRLCLPELSNRAPRIQGIATREKRAKGAEEKLGKASVMVGREVVEVVRNEVDDEDFRWERFRIVRHLCEYQLDSLSTETMPNEEFIVEGSNTQIKVPNTVQKLGARVRVLTYRPRRHNAFRNLSKTKSTESSKRFHRFQVGAILTRTRERVRATIVCAGQDHRAKRSIDDCA